MAYRSGTYVAFDGRGTTDPTGSDMKYYSLLESWHNHDGIEFSYVNSHDKTYQVKDSSMEETLKARIRDRLVNSKNMIVILSPNTRKTGSMLSYEIEMAVDHYKLPLIAVYTDTNVIAHPSSFSSRWPTALAARIQKGTPEILHIPFRKDIILKAIKQFGVNDSRPGGAIRIYPRSVYESVGVLRNNEEFENK